MPTRREKREALDAAAARRSVTRRPLPLVGAAVGGVVIVAIAAWALVGRTSAPPPRGVSAGVTPVALPTFGANAPQNVLDSTAPEILTPTPGASGPTAVVVRQSSWKVLITRSAMPDVQAPGGIAVDADRNVYVADFEGNFIQKFSPAGEPLIRFGQKGNAPGQFAGPTNLALDKDGNIYVADTNNQRIQKLSPTGQNLASWGRGGDGPGQFWLPSGVAVDSQARVYVADRGNHRIQVLGPDGQPLAQWGSRGPAPGQFWSPSDVAVDPKGKVYVADTTNQRVQVLSSSGLPMAQFGWEGVDPGQFEMPTGIAVDASGNIYVSDTRNSRVQKLSPNGEPLAVWGTVVGANTPRPSPEPGTFNAPGGLALDRQGALYVADTHNVRIQKLEQ